MKKEISHKLPEGWKKEKLGSLGNYINGKAFKPSDWKKTGIPIIRIQNLTKTRDNFNYYQGEIEETVDNALVKAEQLRKSILKSAFEGKLINFKNNSQNKS